MPRIPSLGRPSAILWIALCAALPALADNPPATVTVDVSAQRRAISPLIYGVAFGDAATLNELRCTLNRQGGNPASRYNWQLNAANAAEDWYFESIASADATAGGDVDALIQDSKGAGAEAMVTIPMTDWVANLGAGRSPLASFSVAKYGAQAEHDPNWADAGNGILSATGLPVAGNDPNDANVPAGVAFQEGWVQHLLSRWGTAPAGGLKYYLLDNEPSIWFQVHRDVSPTGVKMQDMRDKLFAFAEMIKAKDPDAKIVGFEEWGWGGYLYSGYDQQYASDHGYCCYPDRDANGGWDYYPWLLDQFRQHDAAAGARYLDLLTAHYYPQGGEFSDDVSAATQRLRNRSTRSLWDPTYVDESWIGDKVYLIPRLKQWASSYYPDTPVGVTEYNWGAEGHMNGATAQADILGIFGREGLDAGVRWTAPPQGSPVYMAMRMYRNYDRAGGSFGETSVSCTAPSPDDLSAFASLRGSDGALTVMVVNKDLSGNTPFTLNVSNFTVSGAVQVWQLQNGAIARLADAQASGGSLTAQLPAPSVTLFVLTSGACTLSCSASAPPSGQIGVPVAFEGSAQASACGGNPTFAWSFGDGSTSAEQNPTHTYSAAGTYTWSLSTAAGSAACQKGGTIAVGAGPPTIAGISKAGSPFRLTVTGGGFQQGIGVAIDGTPWTNVAYKGPTKLVLKGGTSLKAAIPKGQMHVFTFANPDGGTAQFQWGW